MKINFTKKEYQTLLDMLYAADWMLHAHSEEKGDETSAYQELGQKIMAAANEFGVENLIEKNDKTGEIYLNKTFTTNSNIVKHLEKYENATFWEELIERLARRDFIDTYGEMNILQMPINERFEKEMVFHKKYDEEFGKNGLKNIKIRSSNKDDNQEE